MLDKDEKVLERIKRPIEDDMCITPRTTPVIYFGNYCKAKACTVSLNPSHREFFEERLCSRRELNKNDNDTLTNEDAKEILKYCDNYFNNNPYRDWFDPFDTFIKRFENYSYYNGTCVHLDLVQWATTPVWSQINPRIRDQHLDNDFSVFEHLLQKNDFAIMFLNGTTVVKNVIERLKINIKTIKSDFTNHDGTKLKIFYGKYNNIKIIGWNLVLKYTVKTVADINNFCDIIKTKI